jgi:hypothetical protein
MSVSKQDWAQWNTAQWAGCQQTVGDMLKSFESAALAVDNGDAPTFLRLADSGAADGLHQTTNAAMHAVSPASDALADLSLKGNQRRFANTSAIDTSDTAIKTVKTLNLVINQVDTDLVRGVAAEYATIRDDQTQIGNVGPALSKRLNDTISTVRTTYNDTDKAVQDLVGITKIGLF